MGYGTPNIRGYGIGVTMVYVTRCVTFPIITPLWPGTAEKRLDLTSYMSYIDAEGRRPLWPSLQHNFSSYGSLDLAVSQPFLAEKCCFS